MRRKQCHACSTLTRPVHLGSTRTFTRFLFSCLLQRLTLFPHRHVFFGPPFSRLYRAWNTRGRWPKIPNEAVPSFFFFFSFFRKPSSLMRNWAGCVLDGVAAKCWERQLSRGLIFLFCAAAGSRRVATEIDGLLRMSSSNMRISVLLGTGRWLSFVLSFLSFSSSAYFLLLDLTLSRLFSWSKHTTFIAWIARIDLRLLAKRGTIVLPRAIWPPFNEAGLN
jgi:hypothetical protein